MPNNKQQLSQYMMQMHNIHKKYTHKNIHVKTDMMCDYNNTRMRNNQKQPSDCI